MTMTKIHCMYACMKFSKHKTNIKNSPLQHKMLKERHCPRASAGQGRAGSATGTQETGASLTSLLLFSQSASLRVTALWPSTPLPPPTQLPMISFNKYQNTANTLFKALTVRPPTKRQSTIPWTNCDDKLLYLSVRTTCSILQDK